MIGAATIERTRQVLLAVTGLACLAYAVLALAQNRPDPLWWWVPGAAGSVAALGILAVAQFAGPKAARQAMDEHYRALELRAAARTFWAGLLLAILAGVFSALGWFDPATLLAALGTAMAGCYLCLLVFMDVRAG